jgi:CheY-like chemotaxis protein
MDIQMPVMNGLEATKEIRNGKAGSFNKDVPIVALSSLSNNGIENKCFLAGMNLYLYKPISKFIIKSALKTFLITV